jgi:hypothetical protein
LVSQSSVFINQFIQYNVGGDKMSKLYGIDDYTSTSDTIESAIDKKVSVLYDFCILQGVADKRENAVRKLLETCGNEEKMQIVLHDVLLERITLTELLQRKGLM